MNRVLLKHVYGLNDILENQLFNLRVEHDIFYIDKMKQSFFSFKITDSIKIRLDNVYKVILTTQKEIENSSSFAGRSVAGALIFGPIGALLGGMSAFSKKNMKVLIISYLANSGELKNIVFTPYINSNLISQYKKELKPIESMEKSDEFNTVLQKFHAVDDDGFL